MPTVTLEEIKKEHGKVAEMIAAFEANAKADAAYPITITFPDLKKGERHVGVIISADGTKRHHIILLPDELENATWKDGIEHAKTIGAEVPDRCEGALLFATMKDEFKPECYWLREPHASGSGFAWYQYFANGYQDCSDEGSQLRVRFLRRLEIL